MKTIESIAKATVRLFEAGDYSFLVNLKEARHIFVSRAQWINFIRTLPTFYRVLFFNLKTYEITAATAS